MTRLSNGDADHESPRNSICQVHSLFYLLGLEMKRPREAVAGKYFVNSPDLVRTAYRAGLHYICLNLISRRSERSERSRTRLGVRRKAIHFESDRYVISSALDIWLNWPCERARCEAWEMELCQSPDYPGRISVRPIEKTKAALQHA